LINGINNFINNTSSSQGAEAVCESGDTADITNTMSTIINATTGGANQAAANLLFKDCIANVEANAALDALSIGGFSTISNAQIQANSMTQSSQEQKVTNQNLEVNTSIEQPKKTSVLPLWGFNRQ
jgi:hypothetical protein